MMHRLLKSIDIDPPQAPSTRAQSTRERERERERERGALQINSTNIYVVDFAP